MTDPWCLRVSYQSVRVYVFRFRGRRLDNLYHRVCETEVIDIPGGDIFVSPRPHRLVRCGNLFPHPTLNLGPSREFPQRKCQLQRQGHQLSHGTAGSGV